MVQLKLSCVLVEGPFADAPRVALIGHQGEEVLHWGTVQQVLLNNLSSFFRGSSVNRFLISIENVLMLVLLLAGLVQVVGLAEEGRDLADRRSELSWVVHCQLCQLLRLAQQLRQVHSLLLVLSLIEVID